jgi:hypothetical protein
MRGRGFAVASTSTALPRALDLFVGDLFLFRRWRSIPAARARPGTMHHACMHGLPAPGARQPVSNRRPARVPVLRSPHRTDHGLGARAPPSTPPFLCTRPEVFIRRPAGPGTSAAWSMQQQYRRSKVCSTALGRNPETPSAGQLSLLLRAIRRVYSSPVAHLDL